MKETVITIKVKLDQNKIPEEIMWSAPDGGMKDQLSKATGNEDLIKIIDEFSQKFESTINQDTK